MNMVGLGQMNKEEVVVGVEVVEEGEAGVDVVVEDLETLVEEEALEAVVVDVEVV